MLFNLYICKCNVNLKNKMDMRKLLTICLLSIASFAFSQENKPTFKAEGDLVKATYYYEDGTIKTQGYFKEKKLTGKWISFDKSGNKKQIAYYDNGKKVGKWFVWTTESLKEINYQNNAVASVKIWKPESIIATKD